MTQEEETKKEAEELLKKRTCEIFSEICDINGQQPELSLEISPLKIEKCRIIPYIWRFVADRCELSICLGCNGDEWAVNSVRSYIKQFDNIDLLSEYVNSEGFENDIKESNLWRYCSDDAFRRETIREYTADRLKCFENELMEVIENVGGREVMRILSPLNHIVAYGGDFEAVSTMVRRISDIMAENRDYRMKEMNEKA